MNCIACFTDDEFQKQLKRKCFGINRFEKKLVRYKELYLEEIKQLQSIRNCACSFRNDNFNYLKWTDDFLQNIQNNIRVIEDTFDGLTEIYLTYVTHSNKKALDKFWNFLEHNQLLNKSEGPLSYNRLLFRARQTDSSFDSKEIKELFHIPFNKRHLISNQRFSISGQPMLYLSNSVLSVIEELDLPIENLTFAGFLPKYYIYYGQKIYEIKNTLFNLLVKSLPAIFESGSQIDYFNDHLMPNYKSIGIDIKKSILSHVLTFPTEQKSKFVPEYVLPQMITTALFEHDYKGIIFPSTKEFRDFDFNKLNNDHEMNIAFFVEYNKSQDYDTSLLNSFYYFIFNGSENMNLKIQDIISRFDRIIKKNQSSNSNNNDFIVPIANTKMHISNLRCAKLNNVDYFDSKVGKIELAFYMLMANELDKYVK
jgi:hypothetical protein